MMYHILIELGSKFLTRTARKTLLLAKAKHPLTPREALDTTPPKLLLCQKFPLAHQHR